MYDRDNDQRAGQSAPLIIRFRLTATLLPGEQAAARILYYSQGQSDFTVLDAANMSIYVHATYYRAFGAVDEDGWAMWHTDSQRWEVISMEGCLLRHGTVTEGGGIAESASGSVALYWNDAGTEATLGIAVTARNIGAALDNGDKVQVWYEPVGEKWYVCQGTGSGGAIVSVASATRDETKCLWAGNIQTIEGSPTSFCTNQFTEGDACWLLVMDFEGGSTAGVKATLPVGEFYFGHLVTTISDVPVYAIRIASQIFHDTADSNMTVDGFAAQLLPDGRTVNVYNWGSELISAGDKISIYHDKMNDVWYAIKSGGGGAKTWHGVAADPIAPEAMATTLLVDSSPVEATNWSDTSISVSDKVVVFQDPIDGQYYTFKAGGSTAVIRFELSADLALGGSATAFVLEYAAGAWSRTATGITVKDMTTRSFTGLGDESSGFRGWCVAMPDDTDQHEIIWMEHKADWAQFRLEVAADMDATQEIYWGEGVNPDEGNGYTVIDPDNLFQRRVNDTSGISLYDPHNNAHIMVQCETWGGAVIIGGLSANLGQAGATQDANCNAFFGSQQDRADPRDANNNISVRDAGSLYQFAMKDSKGYAVLDAIDGVYQPFVLDQKSLVVEVTLTKALAPTDTIAEVEAIRSLTPFPFSQEEPHEQVRNSNFCSGNVGMKFLAMFDKSVANYVLLAPATVIGKATQQRKFSSVGQVLTTTYAGELWAPKNIGHIPITSQNQVIQFEDVYERESYAFRTGRPLWFRQKNSPGTEDLDYIERFSVVAPFAVEQGVYQGDPIINIRSGTNKEFTGVYLANDAVSDNPIDGAFTGQQGPFVIATINNIFTEPPSIGDTWGPKPGAKGQLVKGWPGFIAIGGPNALFDALGQREPGDGGPAQGDQSDTGMFQQAPVMMVLVKLTSLVTNNNSTEDYRVYGGELGEETQGGWNVLPPAYNRTGRTLDADEYCVAMRLSSGWHLVPLLNSPAPATEWKALLTADLLRTDPTGTVETVVALDGSGTDIGTTTIDNPYDLAGLDGATCLIGIDNSGEEPSYFFKQIQHYEC